MQSPNIQSQDIPTEMSPTIEGNMQNQPTQSTSSSSNKLPTTKNNFLTFTIVFGVISIVVSILSPCGMLFGTMGTVFGFKAKEITNNKSVVMVGIILNIIGLIFSLIFAILYAIILSTPELLK